MSINVAVCQFTAGLDVEANVKSCIELVERAAAAGADLAVLPEAVMHFDPGHVEPGPHGQAVAGPFVSALADVARGSKTFVLVGITEAADGGRDLNTLVAIDRTGAVVGAYRKIHLYDAFGFRESDTIAPGPITAPLVFDVDGVNVGALTCYDLRFPEAFRWVTDAGADVIALPAAWAVGPAKEDHWQTLLRARAIENTVYLAAAGQTGPASCGQSMVVDPMGVQTVCAGERSGAVVVAPVDPERVEQVRSTNPSLLNRRFAVAPRPVP